MNKQYEKAVKLINEQLEQRIHEYFPRPLEDYALYLPRAGGKRIRAIIPMLTCGAVSGDTKHALDVGVSFELIHTFTLIHDDIMDHSRVRRGVDALHIHTNTPTAINVGDAMFALAMKILASQPMFEDTNLDMIKIVTKACIDMSIGQQGDMDGVPESKYIKMIAGKTASIFGAAAQCGAIAGFASQHIIPNNLCKQFYNFGVDFGLSFQLRDDILDIGDNEMNLSEMSLKYRDNAVQALKDMDWCNQEYIKYLIKLCMWQTGRSE